MTDGDTGSRGGRNGPSRLDGLALFLAEAAAANPPGGVLHDGFSRELIARGIPLWRSRMLLETLHPEISGRSFGWTDGAVSERSALRRGVEEADAYRNSPLRIVDETGRPFRQRLDRPLPDVPLLDELRAEGATDYLIVPFPFVDRRRSAAISFATAAPGGFSDSDVADLERAALLLSPYVEVRVTRAMAFNLLDAYLGHKAGEKVLDGSIERGGGEDIFAAIVVADLRGFTRLSDSIPRDEVIATLNTWFDALVTPIERNGGEVLEFTGDGLLAIFAADPGSPGAACDAALRASQEAVAATAAVNNERASMAKPPLAFGIALHIGDVTYGNIGSRTRLDFTVIGPAVNHASRLQELTKALGRPIVTSGLFADACSLPLVKIGDFRLRDVETTARVFEPPG
jgi:adenylate cyclase